MAKLDDVANVSKDNDVAKRDSIKEAVMTKDFDIIQDAGNGHLNAAATEATFFVTICQAIVAEGTDYTKSRWKPAWPSSKNFSAPSR